MTRSSLIRAAWIGAFLIGSILLASAAGMLLNFPLTLQMVYGLALGAGVFLALWLLWRGLRVFLWRVGRRLAASYFLIGVLPIPMVVLLILLNLYLLSGYFLGHLYRTATGELQQEITDAAQSHLERYDDAGKVPEARLDSLAFAYYLDGRRSGGNEELPEYWPEWLSARAREAPPTPRPPVSFVARANGEPTLAATAQRGRRAVLAVFEGSIETELATRSDVWVMLLRAEDPRKEGLIRLDLMGKEFVLQPLATRPKEVARDAFFNLPATGETQPWWGRPVVWWGELAGPFHSLHNGTPISEFLTASLNSTPRSIFRHLMGGSAEVNTAIWASLIAITGVLLSIYAVAIIMAFFMIFGLSRAVNQISRATNAVRRGEFSVRIPVRRRDQIGELQQSFNEMAAGLDRSVLAVAQKEVIEKELKIARQLQESLLPADIPSSDRVEFATLFQPSAAIGGDYFDILRLDNDRLVVVIADVSGHGLPTGLRMAMLKAALVILVQENKRPDEIFRRLSAMVRSEQERRFFVTSTLAVVNLAQGEMELTNAAHTPTYLLRQGEVTEIALIGHPLGALGDLYGRQTVGLEDGDVVVWLSDGLVESTDEGGEPFGYDRLAQALRGSSVSASEVRDRLLAAEEAFTQGEPAEDDKTLVAMRYSVADNGTAAPTPE
jgi:serine phosphatase RsbU (regulator of sigma subunit)